MQSLLMDTKEMTNYELRKLIRETIEDCFIEGDDNITQQLQRVEARQDDWVNYVNESLNETLAEIQTQALETRKAMLEMQIQLIEIHGEQ